MKIIDKYVGRNFLIGYVIAFGVLIGLRVIIDLFVNLDEFTEHADMSVGQVLNSMITYYGLNLTLYFRDFAGMITIVAASFSISRMVRSNEFVALMASGVSLRRVLAPILFLSVLLTGLSVIDQELIIPPLGDRLTRSQDDISGQESYNVRFITDEHGSLIFAQRFDVNTQSLVDPTILLRRQNTNIPTIWNITGQIVAESATYDDQAGLWRLVKGTYSQRDSDKPAQVMDSYPSDLTPRDIPLRRKSEYKSLLSSSQLHDLERQGASRDRAQLYSQMSFRVTEPIINLTMLMVCLPILLCRDPKAMKSAVMISFGITGACLVTNFACKMLATEVIFGRLMPGFWAWLPVLIFLPIAFVELDTMKS
jgi:lipopolysaccharide export system permease protein